MDVEIIPLSDGKSIIFRPRIGLAFVGNRAMAALARSFAGTNTPHDIQAAPEVVGFLEQIGFFDPDLPVDETGLDEYCPTTAVLLLTNQCQLRCRYCYAAAGEAPQQELTAELGFSVIDVACANAEKLGKNSFHISFHGGGEPTFAWSVLRQCADYARQKPLQAVLSLTTNGIWSHSQRDWILNNLNSVSLSLDGSPETQDYQRPFVSGKGSSALVMRTATALDQAGFPYGIRMTATEPWDRLPRDIAFLCENTRCGAFQVEPAFNTERGGHGEITLDKTQGFIDAFLQAHEIAQNANRRFYYSGARLGTVTTTFCKAPYQALIVNGSGDLVTCYELTDPSHPLAQLSTIGHIEHGEVHVRQPALDHLHQLMAERRATCQDCFCYWSCAGDCYVRAFGEGTDGHLFHSVRCDMNRQITVELLLRQIETCGGVWSRTAQPASMLKEQ